jgi:UPF0176 protein
MKRFYMNDKSTVVVVASLYQFAKLPDYENFRAPLLKLMRKLEVKGTVLLAKEGVNGTIAGSRASIDAVVNWLKNDSRLSGLEAKESLTKTCPFYRSKVKLKKEIITMGVEDLDPNYSGHLCRPPRLECSVGRSGRLANRYKKQL